MNDNYIGNRIKDCRKEQKMTQKQLGEAMGVSETLISQYERGMRKPKINQLRKIADALNISYNYLVTTPDTVNPKRRKGPLEYLDIDNFKVSGKSNDKETRIYVETLKFLLKIMQLQSKDTSVESKSSEGDYLNLIKNFSKEELQEISNFVETLASEVSKK